MSNLQILIDTLPQVGKVDWIGLRPLKKADMLIVDSVMATVEQGLVGDRYAGRSCERQVTLIQAEHLSVIASCLGKKKVGPELLRRNIVVSGINLLALKNKCFTIGTAKLKVTGLCHPCSFMEKNLGAGGYNAVRGHGGICAKVIESGEISVHDQVCYIAEA